MKIQIIDTETTGFNEYGLDKVLEIGIVELDTENGTMEELYNELIKYDNLDEYRDSWIFKNSDLTLEEIKTKGLDLETVIDEVQEIVYGNMVTAYNVPFDFGKFLDDKPWNLEECYSEIPFDIMDLATEKVRDWAEGDRIEDKKLQGRLLADWQWFPDKWIRSLDAYKALCPDDPAGRNGKQSHRAVDDCIQEGYILRNCWDYVERNERRKEALRELAKL